MSDLRKAAEMALEALDSYPLPFQVPAKEALRQALAQPEWVCCVCGEPEALGIVHSADEPCFHYTKREWVGLPSDEEILEISKCAWGESELKYGRDDHRPFYIAFARAIEAKLKEKNT